jgi:hypothetical protein
VAEKLQPLSKEIFCRWYLDKCCPQRGILLPLLCCLVIDEIIEGLNGNGCFKLGYVLSSAENSQSVSQLL